jgi:hypothetical protein
VLLREKVCCLILFAGQTRLLKMENKKRFAAAPPTAACGDGQSCVWSSELPKNKLDRPGQVAPIRQFRTGFVPPGRRWQIFISLRTMSI